MLCVMMILLIMSDLLYGIETTLATARKSSVQHLASFSGQFLFDGTLSKIVPLVLIAWGACASNFQNLVN